MKGHFQTMYDYRQNIRVPIVCEIIICKVLLCFMQLRIVVSDGGEPALTDTAVMRVFVNRNLASPTFNQVVYPVRILENQLVGLELTPVTCTDADNFVRAYYV